MLHAVILPTNPALAPFTPGKAVNAMFVTKLKSAVVVLALSALASHLGLLTFASFAADPPAAQEKGTAGLSLADFEKLHKQLQPPRDELWRSIPWQISIVEARELAAKEKKPIFVWVASGEPLGCG